MKSFGAFVRKPIVCMGLGSVVLFGATAWAAAPKQSIKKADTPLKVAQLLDCMIQPRFQEDDPGKFGVARFLVDGHDSTYTLDLKRPSEKKLMGQVNQSHRSFGILILHCAHVPGKYTDSKERPYTNKRTAKPHLETLVVQKGRGHASYFLGESEQEGRDWDQRNYDRIDRAVKKAIPQLLAGKTVETSTSKLAILMSPVRAQKTSCLGCHKGAKPGDTLGVMVYAVNRTMDVARR